MCGENTDTMFVEYNYGDSGKILINLAHVTYTQQGIHDPHTNIGLVDGRCVTITKPFYEIIRYDLLSYMDPHYKKRTDLERYVQHLVRSDDGNYVYWTTDDKRYYSLAYSIPNHTKTNLTVGETVDQHEMTLLSIKTCLLNDPRYKVMKPTEIVS